MTIIRITTANSTFPSKDMLNEKQSLRNFISIIYLLDGSCQYEFIQIEKVNLVRNKLI